MLRRTPATSVSTPSLIPPHRPEQPMPADCYLLDGEPVTLSELLAANDFSEAEVAEIKALPPGSTLPLGGGAAPLFTLKRCRMSRTDSGARALLHRMTCGRWPLWRILGTAAPSRDLIVGVEWLRGSGGGRYAVATISLDGRSVSWVPCGSSGDVLDLLDLLERVPAHGTQQVAA